MCSGDSTDLFRDSEPSHPSSCSSSTGGFASGVSHDPESPIPLNLRHIP